MSIIERVTKRLKDNVIQQICEMSPNEDMIMISCKTPSNQIEYWKIVTVTTDKDRIEKASAEIQGNLNLISSPYIVQPQQYFFSKWQDGEISGLDLYMQIEEMNSLESIQRYQDFEEREIIKIGMDITNALMSFEKMRINFVAITSESIFCTKEGDWKLEKSSFYRAKDKKEIIEVPYMAPEEKNGVPNWKTDIYRLGKILQGFVNDEKISDTFKIVLQMACRENGYYQDIATFHHFLTVCYEICDGKKMSSEFKEKAILQRQISEYEEVILKKKDDLANNNTKLEELKNTLKKDTDELIETNNQLKKKVSLIKIETEKKQSLEKDIKSVKKDNDSLMKKIIKLQNENTNKDEKIAKLKSKSQ